MRLMTMVLPLLAACAAAPQERKLTAADLAAEFSATIVTPTPATLGVGLDLPLHPGDRVIANCAQAYAYELPEMTPEEQQEFNAGVICIYPDPAGFDASMRHYMQAFRERRFEDDSGTYVQSGMRIACNQTHSIVTQFMSHYIPRSIMNEKGEEIDIEGGGELANMSIMFAITERPCERHARAAQFSEPPAPENYRDQASPNFLDPAPRIVWGDYELPIRSGDHLVAHCGQYYREVTQSLPQNPTPADFAELNQRTWCIYPRDDDFKTAVAHYLAQLSRDGFSGFARRDAPNPAESFDALQAGARGWHGQITPCGPMNSVILGAMARTGEGIMMDVVTGEFFRKLRPRGGRGERLDANYPHPIITVRFIGGGCDRN